jgi:hypothetical protein
MSKVRVLTIVGPTERRSRIHVSVVTRASLFPVYQPLVIISTTLAANPGSQRQVLTSVRVHHPKCCLNLCVLCLLHKYRTAHYSCLHPGWLCVHDKQTSYKTVILPLSPWARRPDLALPPPTKRGLIRTASRVANR